MWKKWAKVQCKSVFINVERNINPYSNNVLYVLYILFILCTFFVFPFNIFTSKVPEPWTSLLPVIKPQATAGFYLHTLKHLEV